MKHNAITTTNKKDKVLSGSSVDESNDFCSLWKQALRNLQPSSLPTGDLLFSTILKMVYKRFLVLIFLKTIFDSLGFLSPYFVKILVRFLKSDPVDISILPFSPFISKSAHFFGWENVSNTQFLVMHLLFFFQFELMIRFLQKRIHFQLKKFAIYLDASLKQEIYHSVVKTPLYLRKEQNLGLQFIFKFLQSNFYKNLIPLFKILTAIFRFWNPDGKT